MNSACKYFYGAFILANNIILLKKRMRIYSNKMSDQSFYIHAKLVKGKKAITRDRP